MMYIIYIEGPGALFRNLAPEWLYVSVHSVNINDLDLMLKLIISLQNFVVKY